MFIIFMRHGCEASSLAWISARFIHCTFFLTTVLLFLPCCLLRFLFARIIRCFFNAETADVPFWVRNFFFVSSRFIKLCCWAYNGCFWRYKSLFYIINRNACYIVGFRLFFHLISCNCRPYLSLKIVFFLSFYHYCFVVFFFRAYCLLSLLDK